MALKKYLCKISYKGILHSGFILFFFLFIQCQSSINKDLRQEVNSQISLVQQEYAPDSRTAVFEVESAQLNPKPIILKGETNLPEAKKALLQKIAENDIEFIDSIQLLPSTSIRNKFGVISISVANIRSSPEHSAELSTQLILGMPVKILKEKRSWYLIQGPDQYIGWINKGVVQEFDQSDLDHWQGSPKIIYTNMYGFAYATTDKNGPKVSDLVAGNILKMQNEKDNFYKVEFPDGRLAFVNKDEGATLDVWFQETKNENTLLNTAYGMMGIPYLWGGTSVKGMDCSGFTKTVFYLNKRIIPRDASQQVEIGELIDDKGDFTILRPGDLLFFGSKDPLNKKEKVVHVGMWVGNNEFIHASDKVMISSFDPNSENYDQYNLNRYLRTKRISLEPQNDFSFFKLF
jgi:gamma-D-glutamyl-L-lysine dipeptidyl-peptidase